jgi:hypothetical protein
MTTPGGARTTPHVLGAPASLIGSELSVYLAPVPFLALIHERSGETVWKIAEEL